MTFTRSSFRIVAFILLGLACGIGGAFAVNAIARHYWTPSVTSSAPSAANGSGVAVAPVGLPAELLIPRLAVAAPVKPVGVNAKGDIGVPSDAVSVDWYKLGPRPGQLGSAIIDGHVETKYVPQAVFYNLDKLQAGDEIDVKTADGQTIAFTVTGTKLYAYNASTSDLFGAPGLTARLALITCTGDWIPAQHIYNQRLVVFAEEKS